GHREVTDRGTLGVPGKYDFAVGLNGQIIGGRKRGTKIQGLLTVTVERAVQGSIGIETGHREDDTHVSRGLSRQDDLAVRLQSDAIGDVVDGAEGDDQLA